jgi:hypothetical protein
MCLALSLSLYHGIPIYRARGTSIEMRIDVQTLSINMMSTRSRPLYFSRYLNDYGGGGEFDDGCCTAVAALITMAMMMNGDRYDDGGDDDHAAPSNVERGCVCKRSGLSWLFERKRVFIVDTERCYCTQDTT